MSDKIIPINRAMIRSLEQILRILEDNPQFVEKKFNIILIDKKGFMKMIHMRPLPIIEIAIPPKLNFSFSQIAEPEIAEVETVRFRFYREIGDTLEYQEEDL